MAIALLALSLGFLGSCVGKKTYLVKVEEGEKLSRELAALKSEHARLQGIKEALDKQVVTLQGERNDLEKARTELQLKNFSLERGNARLKEEMQELKANPDRLAAGYVVEAKLDAGRGAVATVLVQRGTLKAGDSVVCGVHYGKVRAMLDDMGQQVTEAGPSIPVEVVGLSGVPVAGDELGWLAAGSGCIHFSQRLGSGVYLATLRLEGRSPARIARKVTLVR